MTTTRPDDSAEASAASWCLMSAVWTAMHLTALVTRSRLRRLRHVAGSRERPSPSERSHLVPHRASSSRSLRVAHVISTPTGVGGAETTLARLVSFGRDLSWCQLVLNPFALDPADPEITELYAPATYEGRPCTRWHELPALRRWTQRRLEQFEPDIVHCHLHHASVLVASLPRPAGARLLLSHQHGDHFRATESRAHEALDRLAGLRFDHVVGCSEYVERFLIERYHYRPARVSYVRNGWAGTPMARRAPPEGAQVICVARFRSQKNHVTLIDAIAKVRERVPNVRLILVGDGDQRGALVSQVRRLDLGDHVEFLGSAADVWPLLAEARVFALASTYEPLGIAVLEAMAAGLPVVTTAVGGLPEIVRSGETGFLVPPGDSDQLAARIQVLLTDDALADRMGKAARRTAAEHEARRMVRDYAGVYEHLLSAG